MSVLPQDRCKAQAYKALIDHCLHQVAYWTGEGHRRGSMACYREAQKWSFELRDAQIELNELFLRKEKANEWKNTRIFGRARA